jgi:hypothetical protein
MQRPTFHALGHVLVLLVLWLLPACRTIQNPDYCAGNTDCDDGWTCDMDMNRCVPPPGAGCGSDAECLLDVEPICDLDAEMPTCRACFSSEECRAKNGTTPFCNTNTGRCTQEVPPDCTISTDCTMPAAPICDTGVGECESCNDGGGDAACEARNGDAAPFCVTQGDGVGSCAQCLDSAACTADAPVCDPTARTCGACKEHSDCAAFSGVCDAGACAPESAVVYVAKSGTDSGDCTMGAPCLTLPYARDEVQADNSNKHFIRILDVDNYAGTSGGALTLTNIDISIIAAGATITSIDNNRPIIDVGANTDITLDGVTIRAAGTGVDGVRCQSTGSRVRLEDVLVNGNQNIGVNMSGGCELIIERSVISGNLAGGIKISDAAFTITNTYIVDNGNGAALFGGIQILNGVMAETQILSFNTILNNNATGAADARGVDCSLPGINPLRATSNIIRGGSGGTALLKRANCDWVHSNIEGLPADLMVAEKNNLDDPCDIAPGADNLPRIGSASMCKERGEPGTGIDIDYDGDVRPDGSGADKPDMGADELD